MLWIEWISGTREGRLDQEAPMPKDHIPKPHKKVADDEAGNLKQQLETLTAALQRERADATNIRRQHDEQMANLRTVVKANVVRDLLPVIDNFERALKHVPAELADNDYIKGIQGVVKQFEATLSNLGVE